MQSFVLGCSVLQVVLCAFILPTTPSFRQECPVVLKPDPPTARIMGGRPAADNLVPYLAYIQDPLSKVACTGTVISERHIVTAAHCMVSTSHTILVGIRDVSSLSDKNVAGKVKQFTAHPLWSRRKGAKYDVGVIELESAVSGRAMRVCISKSVPVAESFVRVVGYGATMFQGRREGLRQVDVPVVKTKSCDTAYGLAGADVDGEFEVCAGYLGRGGCDACGGDSGGPMIQYDSNEEAVLVGVVSRGIGCGEALRPGIYARVAAFEEFLDSLVKYEKAVETRAVFSDVNKDANPLKIILIVTCVGMGVVVLLGGILVWYVWAHKGDGDGSRDGNEGNGEDAGSEAVVNEDRARKEGGEVGIRGLEEGQ